MVVYPRVVDVDQEGDPGRAEGVVRREADREREEAAFIGRALGAMDEGAPDEQVRIGADGGGGEVWGLPLLHVSEFLEQAFCGHCAFADSMLVPQNDGPKVGSSQHMESPFSSSSQMKQSRGKMARVVLWHIFFPWLFDAFQLFFRLHSFFFQTPNSTLFRTGTTRRTQAKSSEQPKKSQRLLFLPAGFRHT